MKKNHSKENSPLQNVWQIQEAKAKFSEVVQKASTNSCQIITKQGDPIAVILSKQEYDKLNRPKTSLISFFKSSPYPETNIDVTRSKDKQRDIDL